MKSILIITYYWPPSGGAGVQRWLKLSKYLAKSGLDVHVLTVAPEKASYLNLDRSLIAEISKDITVHETNSFEPIKYYASLLGKKNVPTSGYSNVNSQSKLQKVVSRLRSSLFIPDPRIGWRKYAFKEACKIIEQFNIKDIITTSPPHSTQIIGLDLKIHFQNNIHWTVDFRDPWTDIYYYPLLNHSKRSAEKDAEKEKLVLEGCDHIITLGKEFKRKFMAKTRSIKDDKFSLIPNGYDPDDFKNKISITKNKVFQFVYTGTMADSYEPEIFIESLVRLKHEFPSFEFKFHLIGSISNQIDNLLKTLLPENIEFTSMVCHKKAIDFMLNSDALLLISPGNNGPVPGKLFEYLAAKKPIISIGLGDTAEVLDLCDAGKSFDRKEVDQLFNYLVELKTNFEENILFASNEKEVLKFSRENQALEMIKIFNH